MKTSPDLFYALVAMHALFASAAYCALARTRVSIALLVAACLVWLPLNTPIEGHVLFVFTKHHGVTSADLLSVAGICLAFAQYRRSRPVGRHTDPPARINSSPHQVAAFDEAPTETIQLPKGPDEHLFSSRYLH